MKNIACTEWLSGFAIAQLLKGKKHCFPIDNISLTFSITDIALLGRDIAADAAIKLASTLRPDQEELARVDEPAPSSQWEHDLINESEASPTSMPRSTPDQEETVAKKKLKDRISDKISEANKTEAKKQLENVKVRRFSFSPNQGTC